MITETDIDNIVLELKDKDYVTLYYVCDYNETRNNNNLNSSFKTSHLYKVLEVKVGAVENAYYEYLNFKDKYLDAEEPTGYHIEEDVEHYDYRIDHCIITRYMVKDGEESYTKDINPRLPSTIYGETKIYEFADTGEHLQYTNLSPVTGKFINKSAFKYGDKNRSEVQTAYDNGELNWKYMELENNAIVDGIEYKYVYTDWYILKTINFPTVEYPLINTRDKKCSYFTSLEKAWDFVKECEA
jgi:hypothetical protein